jgi:sporulation protein YlmC with PRC-barrel domain
MNHSKELNMTMETGVGDLGLANPDRPATFEHGEVGHSLLSYSSLASNDVVNLQNEDLGGINDVMLEPRTGQINYAVLSFGGFLGFGEKLFAVPWSAMTLDRNKRCFVLDVDKDRLKDAPGFDKDVWPDMADPEWAAKIHTYYGTKPDR